MAFSRGKMLLQLAKEKSAPVAGKDELNNNVFSSEVPSTSSFEQAPLLDIDGLPKSSNFFSYVLIEAPSTSSFEQAPIIDGDGNDVRWNVSESLLNFDSDHPDDSYRPSSRDSKTDEERPGGNVLDKAPVEEIPIIPCDEPIKRKRQKKAQPELWKRNVIKNKRSLGQKYMNRKGVVVNEKIPRREDCSKCRYKCNSKIQYEVQIRACEEYWNLGNSNKQKMYLSSLIENVPVRRKNMTTITNNRSTSRIFKLQNSLGEKERVCLKFFCGTFAISHRVVELTMRDVGFGGAFVSQDRKIGVRPSNATPEETTAFVEKHIESFPTVESHYCRKDSNKVYLDSDLNLSIMFRLYKQLCLNEGKQPVSDFVYRKIFHQSFSHYSFYAPKKDQCTVCNVYKNAADKTTLKQEWEEHKKREKDAMDMKASDKQKAKDDKGVTFRAISFDLQAILSVPFAGDNQIYYRRKLNVYNFTIFEGHDSNGECFVWDECAGSKGSSEIATCLLRYLSALPSTVTHVSTFSDTCGGQNRNKYFAASMLYAVNYIPNLQLIDVKYMESGHSYLEADSIHATIERTRKNKKIFTTREWAVLIASSRRNPKPYNVTSMSYDDFFDFNSLEQEMFQNTTLNTQNETVKWLKIKWLRFKKSEPFVIEYKYNLSDDDVFMKINVNHNKRKKRSGNVASTDWSSIKLHKKNSKEIPISETKKKDLLFLLSNGVIPQDYKSFIDNLPSTARKIRRNDE